MQKLTICIRFIFKMRHTHSEASTNRHNVKKFQLNRNDFLKCISNISKKHLKRAEANEITHNSISPVIYPQMAFVITNVLSFSKELTFQ